MPGETTAIRVRDLVVGFGSHTSPVIKTAALGSPARRIEVIVFTPHA